jgi:hypothetical protein
VADELEGRIDELYGLPLEDFTAERDALAKELASAGDRDGAARVKALRKPVVAAWAVNLLAREDPDGVKELIELGGTLRSAHRRAVSGGDVEPFRVATEERRQLVRTLTRAAEAIVKRDGGAAGAAADAIAGTLEAATVDEETGELLRSGRLTKPVRPPATFAGAGLRVLEGGPSPPRRPEPEEAPKPKPDRAKLRRELSAAETRERKAEAAVERERATIRDLDRKRSEAKDRLRAAEAELRGVSLERKRLASALDKLGDG